MHQIEVSSLILNLEFLLSGSLILILLPVTAFAPFKFIFCFDLKALLYF